MKLAVITINGVGDYDQWKKVDADYISFVSPDLDLEDEHFFQLAKVYLDRPSYRKISMVSPVVSVSDDFDIYSWSITNNSYEANDLMGSREPHPIQIGYLPGALVKKTVLQKLQPEFTGDMMEDSIRLSEAVWGSGLRCFVDPNTYIDVDDMRLRNPYMYMHDEEMYKPMREMFRREYIR